MKNLYLVLTILGFIAPNIFVAMETIETGNVLLYANPLATMQGMFANHISTAFIVDLLFIVLVFFIWSYIDAKKHGIKKHSSHLDSHAIVWDCRCIPAVSLPQRTQILQSMRWIIETERLRLREFELTDAKVFFDLNADPEVTRHTGDNAFESIEESEQLIKNYSQYKQHGLGRWTVVSKISNEVLGWVWPQKTFGRVY